MIRSEVGPPRGILRPHHGDQKFHLTRKAPGPSLDDWIEHFWIVEWDLRAEAPYVAETLPHPSIHIVLEKGRSEVVGVKTGRFSRTLEGEGRVFGIKWRPGAFRMCVNFPVSELTDRSVAVSEVFGGEGRNLETAVLNLTDHDEMVEAAGRFLTQVARPADANSTLVRRTTELILANPLILRVDDVARQVGRSERTLQRVFHEYVGVNPKWVIKRARLHEAAERLGRNEIISVVDLALELGYFDQAHFIKDFTKLVGKSPSEYAKGNKTGR